MVCEGGSVRVGSAKRLFVRVVYSVRWLVREEWVIRTYTTKASLHTISKTEFLVI